MSLAEEVSEDIRDDGHDLFDDLDDLCILARENAPWYIKIGMKFL